MVNFVTEIVTASPCVEFLAQFVERQRPLLKRKKQSHGCQVIKQLTTFSSIFILIGIIVSGSVKILDYSNRPGESGDVPERILKLNELENALSPSAPTLLLFLHPHCPCTKATIKNLDSVLNTSPDTVNFYAVAFCPLDETEQWVQSPIMNTLIEDLDAKVIIDHGSEISSAFGIKCSGHILLYSDRGELQFDGGITSSRGHEGYCLPQNDLQKILSNDAEQPVHWPVFGCPLVRALEQTK